MSTLTTLGEGVAIVPATAPADFLTQFGSMVTANAVAIVGILFIGVSIAFVMRWFRRSSKLRG